MTTGKRIDAVVAAFYEKHPRVSFEDCLKLGNDLRVIAAETDALLAALKLALPSRCQAEHHASPQYAGGAPCGKCAHCIGTAAIAKAEGREP